MENECHSTQLIDGDGVFNGTGLDEFIEQVKLKECGDSYAVVSIMGPQSSGKSTLLNHLFGTNFREMDADEGRSQTTRGIWLATGVGIEPCTLVMDLEGTDGRERGEDDTVFERQSALFALAVSDIVLINTWCIEIGREQASNKPLLKTVFQVMTRLFSLRKTTLMFVIRDKTRTPLEKLESILRKDVQKIWDSVPKPHAHKEAPLGHFFNVEVVALSSYEEKEEQFREQVVNLRQRFFHSIASGGLAGDRRGVVPASGFSYSAQQIWKVISENKDLDLPTHKVMVATVRCEEIAKEKCSSFAQNEEWVLLELNALFGPIPGFGRKLSTMLDTCLSSYDSEAKYFDEGVRSAKRAQLEEKLLQLVQPAFDSILGHLISGTLYEFKKAFDEALNGGEAFSSTAQNLSKASMVTFEEGCADAIIVQANWEISKAREKLQGDIKSHIASVRAAKLSELTKEHEAKLTEALSQPVEALLEEASDETWPSIRKLLRHVTESAVSEFSNALLGFDLDEQSKGDMLSGLQDHARGVVEAKAKAEARNVLMRMKERFSWWFSLDVELKPRKWKVKDDIQEISKISYKASLKLLSVMAAIRLDDKSDRIKNTLIVALLEPQRIAPVDPLASSTWNEIPSSKTLITPVECKSLWKQFVEETNYIIAQAKSAQEAHAWEKLIVAGCIGIGVGMKAFVSGSGR